MSRYQVLFGSFSIGFGILLIFLVLGGAKFPLSGVLSGSISGFLGFLLQETLEWLGLEKASRPPDLARCGAISEFDEEWSATGNPDSEMMLELVLEILLGILGFVIDD